jgi:hypothetical protein
MHGRVGLTVTFGSLSDADVIMTATQSDVPAETPTDGWATGINAPGSSRRTARMGSACRRTTLTNEHRCIPFIKDLAPERGAGEGVLRVKFF